MGLKFESFANPVSVTLNKTVAAPCSHVYAVDHQVNKVDEFGRELKSKYQQQHKHKHFNNTTLGQEQEQENDKSGLGLFQTKIEPEIQVEIGEKDSDFISSSSSSDSDSLLSNDSFSKSPNQNNEILGFNKNDTNKVSKLTRKTKSLLWALTCSKSSIGDAMFHFIKHSKHALVLGSILIDFLLDVGPNSGPFLNHGTGTNTVTGPETETETIIVTVQMLAIKTSLFYLLSDILANAACAFPNAHLYKRIFDSPALVRVMRMWVTVMRAVGRVRGEAVRRVVGRVLGAWEVGRVIENDVVNVLRGVFNNGIAFTAVVANPKNPLLNPNQSNPHSNPNQDNPTKSNPKREKIVLPIKGGGFKPAFVALVQDSVSGQSLQSIQPSHKIQSTLNLQSTQHIPEANPTQRQIQAKVYHKGFQKTAVKIEHDSSSSDELVVASNRKRVRCNPVVKRKVVSAGDKLKLWGKSPGLSRETAQVSVLPKNGKGKAAVCQDKEKEKEKEKKPLALDVHLVDEWDIDDALDVEIDLELDGVSLYSEEDYNHGNGNDELKQRLKL